MLAPLFGIVPIPGCQASEDTHPVGKTGLRRNEIAVLMAKSQSANFYERVREIVESARVTIARSVNSTQVVANWLVGREIVEEEQHGKKRADYGEMLLEDLAKRLKNEFGAGFSVPNLRNMRQFYIAFPSLIDAAQIRYALRSELLGAAGTNQTSARRSRETGAPPRGESIRQAARGESWEPGRLHPSLSWTHYRTLLRVNSTEVRSFYEIEAIQNNWTARELERQINSLLYERLAKSKDKRGLMRLANKGEEVACPADVFRA